MDMSGFKFDFYKTFEEIEPTIKEKMNAEFDNIKDIEGIMASIHLFDITYNTIMLKVLEKYHNSLMSYLSSINQKD